MQYPLEKVKTLISEIHLREIFKYDMETEIAQKYNYFDSSFFKAFMLAKEKKVEESQTLFDEAEIKLANEGPHYYPKYLYLGTFLPKKAYWHYKTARFDMALYLTIKAILVNEKLKTEKGWNFLVFAQVQQYHNLSRILIAKKKITESIILNARLIWFLITKKASGLKYLNSISLQSNKEESVLRCAMTYQVLIETIQLFSKLKTSLNSYLEPFLSYLKELVPQFKVENENERVLKNLLSLFSNLNLADRSGYKNEVDEFLSNAGGLLTLFPNTGNTLKLFY